MSIFDPNGGFTGTPDPLRFAWGQQAIEDARKAAQGASLDLWPDADFLFIDPLTGEPRLPQTIEDVATVTRGSKSWSDGWSGINGTPAGPLIEHASGKASWSPFGLTVSPAVENLISDPRDEGGDWTVAGIATKVGTGMQDGWPYRDIQFNGTVAVFGDTYVLFDAFSGVIEGDPLTGQVGAMLRQGTMPGAFTGGVLDGGGAPVAPMPFTPDAIHRRYTANGVVPGGMTSGLFLFYAPVGTYSNVIVRFFLPQVTKASYPARPVLPPVGTPGAATRAGETITVPLADWYRHDAGTLVVEFSKGPDPLADLGAGIAGFTKDLYFGRNIRAGGTTLTEMESATSSVSFSRTFPVLPRNIAALGWSGATHKVAMNGTLGFPWTLGDTIPQPDHLRLGNGGLATSFQSGTPIHRVRFFPRELTDAEMIDITTPYWSV